jgi:hypothetical protein
MITYERLHEVLHYSPETGIFTWKIPKGHQHAGDQAGTKMKAGYIRIKVDNKFYLAHRLAWLYVHGKWPEEELDHINHNAWDNRLCNLRGVSRVENCKNKALSVRNNSGTNGVGFNKASNKWQARITVDKKLVHLGFFDNVEDAVNARRSADMRYNFHENHGAC